MSKFNSVLIGSGSGSVGNVTLNKLRGQNIAKAKITTTTNVKSPGQVSSRGKMSNIVLAWQFLSIFMSLASALRKPTESIYNAFVRLFKTGISATIAATPIAAATLLGNVISAARNYATVSSITYGTGAYSVVFDSKQLPFDDHTYVQLIGWNDSTKVSVILNKALVEQDWTEGSVSITSAVTGMTHVGCYLYNNTDKKCSEVYFHSLA
jgi:hypothetical protein